MGTESRIALKTAQALIKGNVPGRVRVLFDSGSHKSFVTTKAASNYGLEIVRKEWVTINTFGQTVKESGLREVVQFDVMPLQADRSLRLEAYVVPEISHISNEHVEVIKNDHPHSRDLGFSDVCQTKEELSSRGGMFFSFSLRGNSINFRGNTLTQMTSRSSLR